MMHIYKKVGCLALLLLLLMGTVACQAFKGEVQPEDTSGEEQSSNVGSDTSDTPGSEQITEQTTEQPEALTAEAVQKMVEEGISKAFKQRGLATSMDDGSTGNVEKSENPHYLHGIL